jgi:hypothetical protein
MQRVDLTYTIQYNDKKAVNAIRKEISDFIESIGWKSASREKEILDLNEYELPTIAHIGDVYGFYIRLGCKIITKLDKGVENKVDKQTRGIFDKILEIKDKHIPKK